MISEDVIVGRGKGFLTAPEKSIANNTKNGAQKVRESRMLLADEFAAFIKEKVEELIDAKVLHHYIEVDSENDFTLIVIILDRKVT